MHVSALCVLLAGLAAAAPEPLPQAALEAAARAEECEQAGACSDPPDLALLQRRARKTSAPREGDGTSLEMVLAVSRHTIKSMIKDYKGLGLSDKDIDQSYGAVNGDATPHGLLFATKLGAHYREQYGAALDLAGGAGCEQIGRVVRVYADEDARDRETGNRWLEGFAPGCELSSVSGELEHTVLQEGKVLLPGCEYASEQEVKGLIGGDINAWALENFGPLMDELQEIFGCCAPSLCAGGSGTGSGGECQLRDIPNEWVGGYWDTWGGGIQYAGWMAATLQTQYVNNNTVLGGASPETIERLYRVTEGIWRTYKNPINANRFGGTLPAYLAAALLSAAEGRAVLPESMSMRGQQDTKFQWFMGHDVNVALLAETLQLSLETPSYPPGTSSIFIGALLFELYSVPAPAGGPKAFTVRVFQEAPTTTQLRRLEAETVPRSAVSLPGCSQPLDCPLEEFVRLVATRVNGRCVPEALAGFLRQRG